MAGFLPAGTFVRCRSRPKEGCGTAHLPQKLSRRQCRNPLVEWQIRGVYPEARATASTPPGAWASARAPPCHSGILSQPKVLCPRCHASALVLPSSEPRSREGRRRYRSLLCRTFFTTAPAVQLTKTTQDDQDLLSQQIRAENCRTPGFRFTVVLLISTRQPFRIRSSRIFPVLWPRSS